MTQSGAMSPDEFTRLQAEVAPRLWAWSALHLGPELRSTVDPEDVLQEVTCRAWRRLPEFDPLWARIQEAGIMVAMHSSDSGYADHASIWEGKQEFLPFKLNITFTSSTSLLKTCRGCSTRPSQQLQVRPGCDPRRCSPRLPGSCSQRRACE